MNDLRSLPGWAPWVAGVVGIAGLAAVLFRIMPPPLRRSQPGISVVVGLGLLLVTTARSPTALLFAGPGCALAAIPLWWIGRLPADMPSAQDPRSREHPRYQEFVRRGRTAGLAIALLEIAWIIVFVALAR